MIELTDPKSRAPFYDKFDGFFRPFAAFPKDPRDLPFVMLTFTALLVLVPFATMLFLTPGFSAWFAIAYIAILLLGFVDKYTLMLHNTSHRRLFTKRFDWMNHLIPAVLAPFMGQSPYTYFSHHIGMHHIENNLDTDLSSTLRFRRDSVRGFLSYFVRFFVIGIFDLTRYQAQRKRWKLARMALVGELCWVVGVVALGFINLWATLTVFIIPYVLIRFLMMAGNWAQHAFVDASDPASPYKNSLNCINTRYNRRCYNDGYHIGHHVKANRHWTEMPGDFEKNRAAYRDNDAIVLDGVDFTQVWFMLMTKQYKALAKRFVDLRDVRRSDDEIVDLLRERTRPILQHEASSPALSGTPSPAGT